MKRSLIKTTRRRFRVDFLIDENPKKNVCVFFKYYTISTEKQEKTNDIFTVLALEIVLVSIFLFEMSTKKTKQKHR